MIENLPDIYYTKNWRELYAIKDNGTPEEYKLETENGTIIYPYIKRPIDYKIDGETYYDTVTPYGFNGPIILELKGDKEKLLKEYESDFQKYCEDNHIIAEYIRFSPWFKNHLDFQNSYNLRPNNKTIAIDLTVDDIFMNEFSSKRRSHIRNAMKNNIEIQIDETGETIDNFLELYKKTIQKNDIGEYYFLDKAFLKRHFELLKNHVFLVNAIYDGKIISSSFFISYNEQLHYHYSANDYDYYKLNGNSLILYKMALWGKEHGKKNLHLGGAHAGDLMNFKLSFTKSNGFDYYVGTRVRQQNIYDEIVKISGKKNSTYFPEYRG